MAVTATDIRVSENVTLELSGFIGRVRNIRPVLLGPILGDIRATEAGLFHEAGGVFGVAKWAPLSPETMRKKTAGGAMSTRILVERGDLERSLTQPNAPGQVVRMLGEDTLEFGTEVVNSRGQQFAHYHQLGTRTMFSRQVMPETWPEEGLGRWDTMVADWVIGGVL